VTQPVIMEILGIDIGGTGIKGAIVDTATGAMLTERYRMLTPHPVTPKNVLKGVQAMVDRHHWAGPIGIGFPGLIIEGVVRAGNNLEPSWIGVEVEDFFSKSLDVPVYVANDADVAGYAEALLDPEIADYTKVIFLTLGTGVGSALIYKGQLVPGTELGSLYFKGDILERYISNKVRKESELSWSEYGKRLRKGLKYINTILSPDRIIIGGGISKKMHKYESFLTLPVPVTPAKLQNTAGTLGAALFAATRIKLTVK